MSLSPRHPVIAGVGESVGSAAPLELMLEAARAAEADAGSTGLLRRVDVICVVDSLSWPAADPGAAVAEAIRAREARTLRTGLGGNGPQTAVNHLAERIAAGELEAALVVGAEAMATLMPHVKRGEPAPWGEPPGGPPAPALADDRPGSSDAENAAGLIAPIFMYPVLEHAIRRAAGRSRAEQLAVASELWAEFSTVAGTPRTAEEIATPSARNRLVSDPYTKLMNARIEVDQGAALLLCSAQTAAQCGVPRDRRVFIHAGAAASDHWFVTERDELHRSPAIRLCGEALRGDWAHVDLYSCFPSAVQIAAAELGLELGPGLTCTGGLTFAGGPGNNYATHGIAALVRRLREDPGTLGLATALGWYATKHAMGVYSTAEPPGPFTVHRPQAAVDALPRREVAVDHHGSGLVESYTALYERDGSPGMGIVVARLPDSRRALAKTHDAAVLGELLGERDPLERPVEVRGAEAFAF